MHIPISGQKPIQPQKNEPENIVRGPESSIQGAMDAMKDAMKLFDNEAQGVSKSQIKGSKVEQHVPDAKSDVTKGTLFAEAIVALEKSEDVDLKKKEKKKHWETQLDKLAELEGALDANEVPKEDQGIIQQFFDNMSKIRTLRRRLKQVKEEKEALKRIIEAEKRNRDSQKRNPG
ncbi:MAG: hypothetical protein EXS67_01440 [Candidatus Margulisbacteria bacterium]|nr:hypothetical protein [Candidatus Margulisiibacteriota bacterium]